MKSIAIYPEPPSDAIAGTAGGRRYNQLFARYIFNYIASVDYVPPLLTPVYLNSLPEGHRPEGRSTSSTSPHWRITLKAWFLACIPKSILLLAGYVKLTLAYVRLFRRYAKGATLIHLSGSGCEVQTLAARLAGIRYPVTTVHCLPGSDTEANHWIRLLIERISFAMGRHHICISDAVFEAWHERVGLSRDRTTIIYNGSEPPARMMSAEDARRRYNVQEGAFVLGMAGRLQPIKGHLILFEALKQVRTQLSAEEWARWQVLVAGFGPLQGELQEWVKREEMPQIHFLGHVQDIWSFYPALDLHVMPSRSEALGLSLIEAMFAGIPSLVSDVGGMKELVLKAGCGRVFPDGDVSACAEALIWLFRDPDGCRQLGASGAAFARAELTAQAFVARTVDVYRQIMGADFPGKESCL